MSDQINRQLAAGPRFDPPRAVIVIPHEGTPEIIIDCRGDYERDSLRYWFDRNPDLQALFSHAWAVCDAWPKAEET